MVADDFNEAAAVSGVIQSAAEKSFRETLDGRERGAKLVRNIRHEILAHALEAAQFADFVQNQDRAGGSFGTHGRCRHRETSRAAPFPPRSRLRFPRGSRAPA